ncbi:HAD-like domain-containing protein [Dunaliella salina]|uniref:HAD-like domain-containing protein n=1 Tax=Dunaliella salina TaxID=3046 RepID=A0ABQ7G3H3_DUNSA|nr:HAD-like domain-containing protein [Dunaliella salina]|eukprot:KAF5829162.1 HAD-like domain-containing protein [Dunaliella salina]
MLMHSRFAQTFAHRGASSKMMPPSVPSSRPAVPASNGVSKPDVSVRSYPHAGNQALVDRKAIGKAEFIRPEDGKAVMDDIDCIIFDCDGVLWRGFNTIPNSPETLKDLRARGKKLLFVTNNAGKSRKGYVKRFTSVGLDVSPDEIVPASFAAAAYLDSINFKATGKKALCIANSGTEEELQEHGIPYIGGEKWREPLLDSADKIKDLVIDENIGAVVVGFDGLLSYSRIVYASCCLRELPGCLFVVTNVDPNDNLGQPTKAPFNQQPLRRMMPVTGTMVQSIAHPTGKQPVIAGKGGSWLFPYLMAKYNLNPQRTAMVGDRLDTDIVLGAEGGLKTIMPLTGVTTLEELEDAKKVAGQPGALPIPDYVINTVATLAGLP